MTKLTFANGNIVLLATYKPADALPAKAPTLKAAAQMAIGEIAAGQASDAAVTEVKEKGEFKDVSFSNGALLTIPSDYTPVGYKQVLEIVVSEIDD